MRLLLVMNYYQATTPNGQHNALLAEQRLLEEHGHEVRIFAADNETLAHKSLPRLALSLGPRVIWSQESYTRFLDEVKRHPCDLVHVHETFPQLSPSIYYAAQKARLPVVHTWHNFRLVCANGTFFRNGAPCTECLDHCHSRAFWHGCYRSSLFSLPVSLMLTVHQAFKSYARQIDASIALSPNSRELLIKSGLNAEQVFLCPNFTFSPTPPPQGARAGFVFAGRLDEFKGTETLVEVIRQAPELGYTVIGSGPLEKRLEPTLSPRLTLTGLLPHDQVRPYLERAKALIFPSLLFENGPLAVIEAFAAGLPVVASDLGAMRDMVRHEENGLLVRAGDASAFAKALRRLEADPAFCARLSIGARQTFETRYAPEIAYQARSAVYEYALLRRAKKNAERPF